jgi:hypothetical protein
MAIDAEKPVARGTRIEMVEDLAPGIARSLIFRATALGARRRGA